ncbi:DUF4253 domain-containing protein [Streptomyces sp. NPDC051940]|uniref:DUF4253 domain-containing protein n=1 Tax=Streptomyces sp. NPDC051940 TaxID=3155675 RepID=UPI003424FF34
MAMTIPEVRRLCVARGIALPDLRAAAAVPYGNRHGAVPVTTVDGTPVYAGVLAGVDAFRLWSDLRTLHGLTGWWPVLAGDPEDLGGLLTGLTPQFAPPSGRPDTGVPDGRELLSGWGDWELSAPRVTSLAARLAGDVDLDQVGGTYISAIHQERTTLCLVRAVHGYHVPALLNWAGACNHDITGAQHGAVLRYFHEQYGAELVTLQEGVMELLVGRRPRTPEGVARAALEQCAYCPDIVDQGVGGIEELARTQVLGGSWYFWWD